MYDNLKEVKMMENNNYKKYMKIFGKDRFSVKLGNFLLLFSINRLLIPDSLIRQLIH